MIPGFVTLGAASLIMPMPSRGLVRLARLAGTTTIVAGIVQVSDPRCPRPGTDPRATRSDVGHSVASVVTFLAWAVMPAVASRLRGALWYRLMCGVLTVTGFTGMVGAAITTRRESSQRGVAQRAFLASVFAWHVATAFAQSSNLVSAAPSTGLRRTRRTPQCDRA